MDKITSSSPAKPARSRKRVRVVMSEGSTIEFSSDAFSTAVKAEAKSLALNQCWNCGANRVEIAHIIAKEDSAVRLYYRWYEYAQFILKIILCSYLRYRVYIKRA
jgi:hypothetical protein